LVDKCVAGGEAAINYMIIRKLIELVGAEYSRNIAEAISFPPSEIQTIESSPWASILGAIDDSTEFFLEGDEAGRLLLAEEEIQTLMAVQIKNIVYRKYMAKKGVELTGYGIDNERLNLYVPTYKLPWNEFLEFMEQNYAEFHQYPERFSGEEVESILQTADVSALDGMDDIDLLGETKDFKPCALCGNIQGLYVRKKDGTKTIYVNRDDIERYIDDFKDLLGEDVTPTQAAKFLDGHETFHALIDKLRVDGNELVEIDEAEEERLADIFGRAFMMTAADSNDGQIDRPIPEELRDELEVIEKNLGMELVEKLEKHPSEIEELLSDLKIKVDIEIKSTDQLKKIKAEADDEAEMVKAAGEEKR